MLTDTHTTVSLTTKKGKLFLRKVLRDGCGSGDGDWMVRLKPWSRTVVEFERTIAAQAGDPSVIVTVHLEDAPVVAHDPCHLTHEAGTFTHLLLDGWTIRLDKKATGSQSSEAAGILCRSLRAEKGYYSTTISNTIFHHGQVLISGACREMGEGSDRPGW